MRAGSIRLLLLLPLCLVALSLPLSVHAQQIRVNSSGPDSLSRVVQRMPLQQARYGITTQDAMVSLLLTERSVILQLTDRGLEQVTTADGSKEGQGVLARMFESMVLGGVRALLNHGIEYPLSDLAEARYEDGRLFFLRNDGERIFEDVRFNDTAAMASFHARDARAFVARFREAKAQGAL